MRNTKNQHFHIENENHNFYFKTCYVASDGKRFYNRTKFLEYELPLCWFLETISFKKLKSFKRFKKN